MNFATIIEVYWFKNLLLPFIVSIIASMIAVFFGIKNLKTYINEVKLKKLSVFWSNTKNSNEIYNILYTIKYPNGTSPYVGYAQAKGLQLITETLKNIFGQNVIINTISIEKDDPIDYNYYKNNLIIFGGEYSLKVFGLISKLLEVPFYQYDIDPEKRIISNIDRSVSFSSVIDKNKDISKDFGTIVRLINPNNGKVIILFNGNYGAGLLASILMVTNIGNFNKTNFNNELKFQELVCEVGSITNNLIQEDHNIEVRGDNWINFSPKNDFKKIIDESSKKIID
jgi:hypothetical protein